MRYQRVSSYEGKKGCEIRLMERTPPENGICYTLQDPSFFFAMT